jgi:hypothetical protein
MVKALNAQPWAGAEKPACVGAFVHRVDGDRIVTSAPAARTSGWP